MFSFKYRAQRDTQRNLPRYSLALLIVASRGDQTRTHVVKNCDQLAKNGIGLRVKNTFIAQKISKNRTFFVVRKVSGRAPCPEVVET